MNSRQKIAAARLWAVRQAPYFATGLLTLRFKEVPLGSLPSPVDSQTKKHIGTMGTTDRGVVYYEEACVERWTVPELGSVIVHELLHYLRKHGGRCERNKYKPRLWNVAADFEINDDLSFLKLPDGGGMHPKTYGYPEGLLAETYYEKIRNDPRFKTIDICCGSAAGNAMPDEPVDSTLSHTDIEIELAIKQVAQDIRDEGARGRGTIPEGLRRWADFVLKPPKVSWDQKLKTRMRSSITTIAGATDYTYSRINRRQGGLGFGLGKPILRAPIAHVAKVDIGLDTSGSMGKGDTSRAISEAAAILKATKAKARFLACDAAVHSLKEVANIQELISLIKGGGGTSFLPVFEAWEKLVPKTDLAIFFTDGGGDAPSKPPSFKTIFVLIGKHKMRPWSAAEPQGITWGEFIEIDEGTTL